MKGHCRKARPVPVIRRQVGHDPVLQISDGQDHNGFSVADTNRKNLFDQAMQVERIKIIEVEAGLHSLTLPQQAPLPLS